MRNKIACAAAAALLAGCQTSYVGDENSPYYAPPPGSRLVLNQELRVPAGKLAVYIQNGRVMQDVEVQHYYPFCKFELAENSSTARPVQPDQMIITRSAQTRVKGATALAAPVVVAGGPGMRLSSLFDDDRPTYQSFSTRMDLRSEKQPEIFRLSCAVWDTPSIGNYVTIAQMRRTLGDVFTLQLPPQ